MFPLDLLTFLIIAYSFIKKIIIVQYNQSEKFIKISSKLTIFLKLLEPNTYTGHCFRRSSAILLANSGNDLLNLLTLKKHS